MHTRTGSPYVRDGLAFDWERRLRFDLVACLAAGMVAIVALVGCVSRTYLPPASGGVEVSIRWDGGIGSLTLLRIVRDGSDEYGRLIELYWEPDQPNEMSVPFAPGQYAAIRAVVPRSFSERLAFQACGADIDCQIRHVDHGVEYVRGQWVEPGIQNVEIRPGHTYELTIDNSRDGWVNVVLLEDGQAVAATHPEVVPIVPSSERSSAAAPVQEECRLNSDCPVGRFCDEGRCHADCREDRDCPAGSRCRAEVGQCSAAETPVP